MTAAVVVLALLLDCLIGELRRCHPLVAFGRWAGWIESQWYAPSVARGALLLLVAVGPFVVAASFPDHFLFDVLVLYLAIGARSLAEHARGVHLALCSGNLRSARQAVGRIVSRNTEGLSPTGVSKAAVESVLENGSDAVFGAIFWFVVAGAPGVVLYRLVNTLDAMWGYRNPRYALFGRAAARLDDLLNYLPARLTALSYALAGRFSSALTSWRLQAPFWESPNAGPVMAAGAGALMLRLGGPAIYDGERRHRPELGFGREPAGDDIPRALALLRRALWLWVAVIVVANAVAWFA